MVLRFIISQSTAFGVEKAGLGGFSKELIESDFQVLQEQVTYRGAPPVLANLQSEETKDGGALLVVRSTVAGVDPQKLNKLSDQLAGSLHHPELKVVTLSDLNITSNEAKNGRARQGQLLNFNEDQSAVNAAIARGLGMVLFIDLIHLNARASSVPGATKLNLLNARASLTLLNAADGIRIKTSSREVNARGVDPHNLEDKAFDILSKDLASEVNAWVLPPVQIKLIELEVHAKMDGIFLPIMDVSSDAADIKITDVPVFAEDASVEIDGVLKGRAPCRINVSPGSHQLKVYREGAQSFSAVIQVNASNRYDALLVPTPEFRRRFEEQMEKFEKIKAVALKRKAELEAAGVRVEGLRVKNANARDSGVAEASVIQSRAEVARETSSAAAELVRSKAASISTDSLSKADVARTDAQSRGAVASGAAAVLQGSASLLQERAKGQSEILKADADMKRAEAEAVRKGAEGKLAIDKETAKNMSAILKVRNEMLQAQVEAFRSFSEKLGGLAFRIGSPRKP